MASRRRQVIDLTIDDPESEEKIVVKAISPPRPKRKAPEPSDSNEDVEFDWPVKRTKRRSARSSKTTPSKRRPEASDNEILYDSSDGNESDNIHACPRKTTRTSARPRAALQELDPAQFTNKLRERLYVQRPPYSKNFLSQFSRVDVASRAGRVTKSPVAGRKGDIRTFFGASTMGSDAGKRPGEEPAAWNVKAQGVSPRRTSARSRSKRMETRRDSPVDISESEDELAVKVPAQTKTRGNRPSCRTRIDSESEFEVSGSAEDENEDSASPGPLSESSAADASEDSDQDIVRSKPQPHRKQMQPKPSARQLPNVRPSGNNRMRKLLNRDLKTQPKGLDERLPPLVNIGDIFNDLTVRALPLGLHEALKQVKGCRIRVATMCSGTESPLLAIEMIRESLRSMNGGADIDIDHVFSAEIVPFKQAYIERNFAPPIIFRDITELTSAMLEDQPMATTAYGGKVAVPKADIVIAGTSCVDFSRLNSKKKGLDDGGESADTWEAVLAFCKVARPAIALLENVRGAAWDAMLSDYESIGYEAAGVLVDTKDFYLPQTRQRGYMACFNNDDDIASGRATEKWADLMGKFRRLASAPVSSFLLPNDQIARQQLREDEPLRDVDWSKCEIRQMQYRQEMRLGSARPVTHWAESGAMLVPETGYIAWFQKQVERVLDTIDAATLRKALPANGMFDAGYKTRIWDLSQNIDRDEDSKQFGIIGCITPSGQFFISDDCRALTPAETLILQGIPLQKISFTTETPAEMQDLAGNAMSSTVIGSSILAALIAGASTLRNTSATTTLRTPQTPHTTLSFVRGTTEQVTIADGSYTDLRSLLQEAQRSRRMCYCESKNGQTELPLQRCRDCGHITCVLCGGNPPHTYAAYSPLVTRGLPARFADQLRSALPLRLEVSGFELTALALPSSVSESYRDSLQISMSEQYSLQGIRRTHYWTARYQSASNATLELVFCNDDSAEWRLFASVPKQIAENDDLRRTLRQPVAKCPVRSSLLSGGEWRVRSPCQRIVPLEITPSGSEIASWWCRNGMPDFGEHHVSEFLHVTIDESIAELASKVNGRYQHLPHCGFACASLYKKVQTGSEPLYLFLDPTRTGDPAQDCFVFSHVNVPLERDEVRPILARIDADWRPWCKDGKTSTTSRTKTKTKLIIDDSWMSTTFQLRPYDTQMSASRTTSLAQLASSSSRGCDKAIVLASCVLIPEAVTAPNEVVVDASDYTFFAKFAWAFEIIRRSLPGTKWVPFEQPHSNCDRCAPKRPGLRWGLANDHEIKPYEDPAAAAKYEKAIKSRPTAVSVRARYAATGTELALAVNAASLLHRAQARLAQFTDDSQSCQWRFTAATTEPFRFRPFKLRETSGIVPYEGPLAMSVELFPKQRTSLAWMKQQETGNGFVIEENEEASIAFLQWRAEARVQATVNVRGGICADHPGFGKTITSLALIQSHILSSDKSGIVAELQERQSVLASGLIPTQATLIVCPASLLKQWANEIVDKLNWTKLILVFSTLGELSKASINDFQAARIVLVNRTLLGSEPYAERLAAFAAIPGPATKSGRAYAQWLQYASEQVPGHLKILLQNGKKDLERHVKATYEKNITSDAFKIVIPSRRLRGQNYQAAKGRTKTADNLKAASASVDISNLCKPLFEMFYFNRIIIDEFHQYEPREYAAITSLKADKRWGLSATPAIGDFYDIAQMAGLLGIPLRIGSDARGLMKNKNIRDLRKDMTDFERFDAMRVEPSDAVHSRIWELDQLFLDTFVRQNVIAFDDMPFQEHLVPVRLEASHLALYTELSQQLNSADMRIKKGSSSKTTKRQSRFNTAVSSSATAEEALTKAAACFNGIEGDASSQAEAKAIEQRLIDTLAQARHSEPKVFEGWRSRIDTLGDQVTIDRVKDLVRHASKPSGVKSNGGRAAGTFTLTATLQNLCQRLLVANRSARYLQNIEKLREMDGGDLASMCECLTCLRSSGDVAVSAYCGHVVCRPCYEDLSARAMPTCQAHGCSGSLQAFNLLWADRLSLSTVATAHGAKIDAAVKLLQQIAAKDEQAILFVQFENQLEEVEAALDESDIQAVVVKSVKEAGNQIADFRESAGAKDQKTVIVLNASDETAAGSNLQNANHVIFLGPLLRDTQYGYDSTMAQAIGRVRRHGQKRDIHVYRLVALDTIDVDILEHRERRIDALVEQGAPQITIPAALHEGTERERTQLVREDGHFSLRPRSWLLGSEADGDGDGAERVQGKSRVLGWEDFSSLVKFSKTYTEDG